jgi:hypothetical protein
MSFLDRIPGLRRKASLPPDATEHVMMPEAIGASLIRTGKWVWHGPSKAVGILTSAADFPNCRIMLTDGEGFDLRPITCHLTEIRVAKLLEIPERRRPSADIGASLGYY